MPIPFTKMEGAGNDFVLIDARAQRADWARLAPPMCDRHFGIGADGVLVMENSEKAIIRMRLFNADGSEAEMCGNGLRCVAKWAIERGGASPSDEGLAIETGAGVLSATVTARAEGTGAIERVRLAMGAPRFAPAEIPVVAEGPGPVKDLPIAIDGSEIRVTCLSMGNPHAVHITDRPVDQIDLARLGPLMERHDRFPQRTNFEVVNVESPQHLRVRVWERGVGLTLACGSGASAAIVAARLHGLAGQRATVSLPGGDLELEWDAEGPVYLEGPAAYVFEGEWSIDGYS